LFFIEMARAGRSLRTANGCRSFPALLLSVLADGNYWEMGL